VHLETQQASFNKIHTIAPKENAQKAVKVTSANGVTKIIIIKLRIKQEQKRE
jgi:hypothetical protein